MEEQIQLQNGPLRFSALAQGQGPIVLCLHGFPDNLRSYRLQLPVLAAAGYRAISVSMRGYEPSSIPADGDYHLPTLATDVVAWIDQLGAGRVHLVGHDWGAMTGYHAAALAPDRFLSMTAMAIPHIGRVMGAMWKFPRQLALSWYVFFLQLRGIADYAVERNDFSFVRMLWRRWSPGWEPLEEELRAIIEGLRQPGVKRAALGYYRASLAPGAFPLSHAARKQAGFQVPVPTLGVTGERDGCLDSNVFQALMCEEDFPRGLVVRQLTNTGHFPHLEQPETVNKLLLDWFAQHDQNV